MAGLQSVATSAPHVERPRAVVEIIASVRPLKAAEAAPGSPPLEAGALAVLAGTLGAKTWLFASGQDVDYGCSD